MRPGGEPSLPAVSKMVRPPGASPEPPRWQRGVLMLHHGRHEIMAGPPPPQSRPHAARHTHFPAGVQMIFPIGTISTLPPDLSVARDSGSRSAPASGVVPLTCFKRFLRAGGTVF